MGALLAVMTQEVANILFIGIRQIWGYNTWATDDIILIYFLFDSMYKKIVVQIKRTACSYNQKFEKLQL